MAFKKGKSKFKFKPFKATRGLVSTALGVMLIGAAVRSFKN